MVLIQIQRLAKLRPNDDKYWLKIYRKGKVVFDLGGEGEVKIEGDGWIKNKP